MDLALLVEQHKDCDGVVSWDYLLHISPISKIDEEKSKI